MGDWRPFVYGGLASVTAEIGMMLCTVNGKSVQQELKWIELQ